MGRKRTSRPKVDASPVPAFEPIEAAEQASSVEETGEQPIPKPLSWWEFLEKASDSEVQARFKSELADLAPQADSHLTHYNILVLLQPEDSIGALELDWIYSALSDSLPKDRDIFLVLLSRGGIIEPAYQISKLCRVYAKDRFVVAVPRQAKSAATLIALGADEIHMGPLGQLGPIDPQLGGLPALAGCGKTILRPSEQPLLSF